MTRSVLPDFAYHPAAFIHGSLPDGGYVADTPIWAAKVSPFLSPLSERQTETRREDIALGDKLAFVIENVLDAAEADTIVALTEKMGYRPEAPGISTPPGMRQNKTVHWISDETLLGQIFERIRPHLPQVLDGAPLAPRLSHRINMYRYDDNDVFNLHTDGDWPGFGLSDDGASTMVQWQGVHSKLTMLLCLNGHEDGVEGGETHLYDRGEMKHAIAPKKGRALFFRHGGERSSVLHGGARVSGPVSKYVARINVLYQV
jgi:hypothetical protein